MSSHRWPTLPSRLWALLLVFIALAPPLAGADLAEVRSSGQLRHLGVPYANFVTGAGDGLDVELMRGFAHDLGVEYRFVQTDWQHAFGDLTGHQVRHTEKGAETLGETPVRGDVLANGVTVLAWRKQVADFSTPTFPSAVWLIARGDSSLQPIHPSGSLLKDIGQVKAYLAKRSVLGLTDTCLDPALYRMGETQAVVHLLPAGRNLNEMVPAILNGDAESTLLDVPDALIALERWPGEIKVIGPISESQTMAVAFPKSSPQLREAFNRYFAGLRSDGRYNRLVAKYYPSVFRYYADFFHVPGEP